MIILLITSVVFHTVSVPANAHTLSNPSFTSYFNNYEFYVGHRDIGAINFLNLSARYGQWGFGASSHYTEHNYAIEKRNWLSTAYHFNFPVSAGMNFGLFKSSTRTTMLCDIGIWSRSIFNFGVCCSNLLSEEKSARVGGSYDYKQLHGTLEFAWNLQDQAQNQTVATCFLLSYEHAVGDFDLKGMGGYHPREFVWGLAVTFREFICASLYMEDTIPTLMIGVNFSPPVITREVALVETLMVEKPLVVKKIRTYELTSKDLDYCESHYRQGIEYYLANGFEQAITEWNLVIKVYPQYKDVVRYLDTAKKKKDLLKQ